MNNQFIKSQIKVATYAKKEDTQGSFYKVCGDSPLPKRLSIKFGSVITSSKKKGRMVSGDMVVGEIRGEFTKTEESSLKKNKPYKINSKIFRKLEFPQLGGYGTLAISNPEGRTSIEEGVVIFADMGENILKIFFMAGECYPSRIDEVCAYVSEEMKKGEV